jgi:SAM-dependent methyltransferase
MFAPLYEAVLQKTAVGPGTALLDIGCGSGVFCQMAMKLGAQVSGLDAAESLLAIARERVPQGDIRAGEMEDLPYTPDTFNVVTGFNSFQFAARPFYAIKEARRVSQPGASLVIAVLGKPEDTEAVNYFAALASLLPPPPPGTPGPFALSYEGALEALVTQVGMKPGKIEQVDCPWEYPDEKTLLRGLLSTAPSLRVIQQVGEAPARDAILKSLAPFKTASGGYQLKNKARYMIVKT